MQQTPGSSPCRSASEQPRGLLLGEVLVIPKNDHRTLARWQSCECAHHVDSISPFVLATPFRDAIAWKLSVRALPIPRQPSVDDASTRVRLASMFIADPWPRPVSAEKGLLDEIFGPPAITAQKERGAEERVSTGVRELPELCVPCPVSPTFLPLYPRRAEYPKRLDVIPESGSHRAQRVPWTMGCGHGSGGDRVSGSGASAIIEGCESSTTSGRVKMASMLGRSIT